MKKLSCLFVSILILLSIFSFSVSAAEITAISVGQVKATQGSTVALPINVANNQGIWGMILDLEFDTDTFEVVEVRNNAEVFTNGEIMVGPSNFNLGYVRMLATSNNLTKNNINNGTLCTVILKVSNTATQKSYPFILNCTPSNICDINSKDVPVNLLHGSITIDNNYQTTTTKKDNPYGEIVNTMNIDDEVNNGFIYKEPETKTSIAYVTDKAGEVVTNKQGEQKTQIIIQTVTTKRLESVQSPTDNKTVENVETANSNSLSTREIILIIVAALVIATIITVVIATVSKKERK